PGSSTWSSSPPIHGRPRGCPRSPPRSRRSARSVADGYPCAPEVSPPTTDEPGAGLHLGHRPDPGRGIVFGHILGVVAAHGRYRHSPAGYSPGATDVLPYPASSGPEQIGLLAEALGAAGFPPPGDRHPRVTGPGHRRPVPRRVLLLGQKDRQLHRAAAPPPPAAGAAAEG